jgi:hypothetical protein
MRSISISFFLFTASLMSALPTYAQGACAPDLRIENVPTLAPQTDAKLVSHTVRFDVNVPAAQFNERLAKAPLQQLLPGTPKIPAVSGTRELTDKHFGQVGAPRVVCLVDGAVAVEEVTENSVTATSAIFRYKVWNYSNEVAKPIDYGIGEFKIEAIDDQRSKVSWTYSFKLREDRFPGCAGALGRWLFDVSFLQRDYADMMNVSGVTIRKYFQ